MVANTASSVHSAFAAFTKSSVKSQATAAAGKSKEAFCVKKNENVDKVEVSTSGLSEKAQAYLAKLEEKFDNINFVIGSTPGKGGKGNEKADGKDYNCFMSAELLERMANDEEVGEKYEGIIADAIVKVEELKQTVEEEGLSEHVKSYGVKINDDGSVNYTVMLNKSVKGLFEKKVDDKPEHKDIHKGYKSADSPRKLEESSIEELLEKLRLLASARIEVYLEKHSGDNSTADTGESNAILDEMISITA